MPDNLFIATGKGLAKGMAVASIPLIGMAAGSWYEDWKKEDKQRRRRIGYRTGKIPPRVSMLKQIGFFLEV